ncbi:hypothetical protein WJX74_003558 [Apatococcus lobatus]|uniref:Protein kinase domain-containing protein n=1 Tax=Apatococcus lobatus TaxID=904363 RepID=A0AAW1SA18_9CHLO
MALVRLGLVLSLSALLQLQAEADQGRSGQQYRQYQDQQDCATPHGLRQVLCSRDDTSTMCRFFDAQSEGAAFQLPSLGSGVTIFVLVDAAVSRVKYMSRSSSLAQTIRALSANEIPDAKRISMRMYLQLPEPLDRQELVIRERVPTVLSRMLKPSDQYDLTFSQTGDGQVEITSLSRLSRARILDSVEICGSWIHTVDGLILPSSDNSIDGLPDIHVPKPVHKVPDNSQDDSSSAIIASGLLGGIAVLLGTLSFQWVWAKLRGGSTAISTSSSQRVLSDHMSLGSAGRSMSTNSNHVPLPSGSSQSGVQRGPKGSTSVCSDDSETNLQDSVDRAVGRALEKWAGDSGMLNALRSAQGSSSQGHARADGSTQAARSQGPSPRELQSSQLSDLGGSRNRTRTPESELTSPKARALAELDKRAAGPYRSGGSSQSHTSLEEIDESALPLENGPPLTRSASSLEEPSMAVRRLASIDNQKLDELTASSGSTAPAASARLIKELLEDGKEPQASELSEDEVTWESVQEVFDRVQDRSWQLLADDLTVCLRPDGTDWILGAGGFGRVYKGILHGSTPVAVKFITRQTHKEKLRFVSEIHILKNLRHVNITQFMGAHVAKEHIILASEYMPRGDLWNALNNDSKRQFGWYARGQQIALDIVRGLVFMHSKSMVHLDLKTSNILLSRDGTAKIADVGLARILTRADTQVSAEGTFEWAAPEILMGQACSEKADIYSLGVILWEICTGEHPKLRSLRPFRCPEELPANAAAALTACRAPDPKDRPSARHLFAQLASLQDSSAQPAFRSLSSCSSAGSSEISQYQRRHEETGPPSQPPISKSGTVSTRTPEGLQAISEMGINSSGNPSGDATGRNPAPNPSTEPIVSL